MVSANSLFDKSFFNEATNSSLSPVLISNPLVPLLINERGPPTGQSVAIHGRPSTVDQDSRIRLLLLHPNRLYKNLLDE
jgi:hypothetical protein